MTDEAFISLAALRKRAAELGLSVGVSAAVPGPEGAHLERWLAEGRHGEMGWLARASERRADPRRVVEGARSVISVGMSYYSGELPVPPDARPRGRIARYAMGDDYHDVMLERVRSLAAELGDDDARAYVDTGPVLEKAWAERSGLGWIGKHTNNVSQEHGSWWFLGAVVSRREVEPTAPMEDHCGTCTSCFEACPTGAIRADQPGQMDARLCISYLTIELRGPIPRELRPLLGNWIFGCDLCLDVCPWNRFAEPTSELRFQPRPELLHPDLEEMLSWSQERFSTVMKDSPIKRTKRRGLLRNVAVALGNSGDPRVVPALVRCLAEEPEALVRGHAAWALGRLAGDAARRALEQAQDADAFVTQEIRLALDELRSQPDPESAGRE